MGQSLFIQNLETRRLFSGSGHHDAVDVDGPNHEKHDAAAVHEAAEHHRGKGQGGPATSGHHDAVDHD